MSLFDKRAVAAAVRTEEDFSAALKSEVDVIFLLYSSIMTVEAQIDRAHKAGKKALIHMDFAEGIGKDRAGLHFIKLKGADGILTTKTNMIRPAKDIGLVTVQRFFIGFRGFPFRRFIQWSPFVLPSRMWWRSCRAWSAKRFASFRTKCAIRRFWQAD